MKKTTIALLTLLASSTVSAEAELDQTLRRAVINGDYTKVEQLIRPGDRKSVV